VTSFVTEYYLKEQRITVLSYVHIYTQPLTKRREKKRWLLHSCRFTAAHVKHFWSRRDLTWQCGAFQGTGSVVDIICLKEKYVKQWKRTVTSLPFLSWSHPFIGLYEKSHLLQDIEEITDLLVNRSMPVWNHHLCNTESKSSSEHYKICHRHTIQMLLNEIWICAIDIIFQGLVF